MLDVAILSSTHELTDGNGFVHQENVPIHVPALQQIEHVIKAIAVNDIAR